MLTIPVWKMLRLRQIGMLTIPVCGGARWKTQSVNALVRITVCICEVFVLELEEKEDKLVAVYVAH